MVIGSDDLERLSTEYIDRIIQTDMYCSRCGYNLRTRGRVDRCPECGNNYNARSLNMEGIFTAELLAFPSGDLFATLLSGGCAYVLARGAFNPIQEGLLFFAATFAVLAVFFGRLTWRRAARYFHYRGIARQIESHELD